MMPTFAILAGGKATRLYPVTQTIPKSMLELAGKPFIAHQIDLLKKNGVSRLVICAGHFGEILKDYVGDGGNFGLSVDYSFDGGQLLGTAGAVKKALPLLGESFAVMYGDSYLAVDYRPIADVFLKSGKKGLMTVFKNEGRWEASNIVYMDGTIEEYDKKNVSPQMKHIDYGLLFFKKEAFSNVPDGQVYDLADLCRELIAQGQMAGYEVTQRFYEIGSPKGLVETGRYLEERKSL
jgi:NDP-sugar pyrophosphorylase family protein